MFHCLCGAGYYKSESFAGLHADDQVMILWNGLDVPGIQTYEIVYSETLEGTFKRVNRPDLLSTAYLHVRHHSHRPGYYRIRCLDYWGRLLGESSVLQY